MKKKHRNIVVNGTKYRWTVKCFGKEKDLQIWLNKKPIFTTTLRLPEITPRLVSEIIEEELNNT